MHGESFIALLPLLIVAAAAVAVMLAVAVHRSHALSACLAFVGLAAAFGSLWMAAPAAPAQVTPLLVLDRYSLFYIGLILAAGMAFVPLAYGYFEKLGGDHDELYILLLVATLGSAVLVASSHFVSLFLGLELLSVALYGMIAYPRFRPLPLEAGIKYLVLAAVSAAFLLFGMALIYGALGTMQFTEIAARLAVPGFDRWLVLPGLALILTGFGFKLAVVPFHLWTPDVYQGAPAPVTAYIATVSKGAMFAVLLRYFYGSGAHDLRPVYLVFTIIAIASMFAGNILALLQSNVKRILAYSSIAHLGYLLVAFQASGDLGPTAVTFYLVAYFVTILGAFGVVSILSDGTRDADALEDYRGLFWRRPRPGGRLHGDAAFPRRNPGNRGLHRQVLRRSRRRVRGDVGADRHPRDHQCDRPLLLFADRRGAVRATQAGAIRSARAGNSRRVGAGVSCRLPDLLRSVPSVAARRHSTGHFRSSLTRTRANRTWRTRP